MFQIPKWVAPHPSDIEEQAFFSAPHSPNYQFLFSRPTELMIKQSNTPQPLLNLPPLISRLPLSFSVFFSPSLPTPTPNSSPSKAFIYQHHFRLFYSSLHGRRIEGRGGKIKDERIARGGERDCRGRNRLKASFDKKKKGKVISYDSARLFFCVRGFDDIKLWCEMMRDELPGCSTWFHEVWQELHCLRQSLIMWNLDERKPRNGR